MSSTRYKQATIKSCTCKHDYQDKVNGKHKRLFNYSAKAGKYRCTVCGVIR